MRKRSFPFLALGAALATSSGCGILLGLGDYEDGAPTTSSTSTSGGGGGGGPGPVCSDLQKNGKETDKDCGGDCDPCADGLGCIAPSDCVSLVCTSDVCQTPTCSDMAKNGKETDEDCGGGVAGSMCGPCAANKTCVLASDCASGVCSVTGVCQAPACDDLVMNGNETATDCGGGTCPGCAVGAVCVAPTDCDSAICQQGMCVTNHMWSKGFGDDALQEATAVIHENPGTAVVGNFNGTMDFGGLPLTSAGGVDIFLAQFNTYGTHLWSKSFGDGSSQKASAMVADFSGNLFLTGAIAGTVNFGAGPLTNPTDASTDVFLAMFDKDGDPITSVRYNADGLQEGTAIALGPNYVTAIGGNFTGNVDFGCGLLYSAGGRDAFVVVFDGLLNCVWSKSFGDDEEQFVTSVAFDDAGALVVGGRFFGSVDLGGGPLTVVPSSQGAFVGKFDATGAHLFSNGLQNNTFAEVQSVATVFGGETILAGRFKGTLDFGNQPLMGAGEDDMFLAKLDSTGAVVWQKAFGDATPQNTNAAIALDIFGSIVVTGSFQGSIDFGGGVRASKGDYDVFVAKFDPTGAHVWSQTYGGSGLQKATAVTTRATTEIVVAGLYQNAVDFGGGSLVGAGSSDVFMAKLMTPP